MYFIYLYLFVQAMRSAFLLLQNTLTHSHGMTIVLLWHVNLFRCDQFMHDSQCMCVSSHIAVNKWRRPNAPCASYRCESESVSRNVSPFQIDFRKMAKFMITRIIIINHVIWRLAIFYSRFSFFCSERRARNVGFTVETEREAVKSSNSIYEICEIIHFTFRFLCPEAIWPKG